MGLIEVSEFIDREGDFDIRHCDVCSGSMITDTINQNECRKFFIWQEENLVVCEHCLSAATKDANGDLVFGEHRHGQ